MKILQVMILSMISLLLLPPLQVVESSSLNNTTSVSNLTKGRAPSLNNTSSAGNITRGSVISTFGNISSTRWLSPSGTVAFGFYTLSCPDSSQHCPDQHGVGIYSVESQSPTLVWKTDHYYDKPSVLLFTGDGKLVLRTIPDNNKEEPLIPSIQEPLSYAMMLDNGNFVLFGSKSQIVWQSFDHPTNTTGGQNSTYGGDHDMSLLEICFVAVLVVLGSVVLFLLLILCFPCCRVCWAYVIVLCVFLIFWYILIPDFLAHTK